ncbi:MAG: hypothetical protein SW833_04855 [Cyanobacteriota bacterium]|nr:hypothetical protein [Cyanobacteriota bacterium]
MNEREYLEIEKSQVGLYSKFCALRDEQLLWYETEALSHFGLKKFPSISRDNLIRKIFAKSKNDRLIKEENKTYYIANIIAYLRLVRQLLTENFIEQ